MDISVFLEMVWEVATFTPCHIITYMGGTMHGWSKDCSFVATALFRNILCGGPNELHQRVHFFLHFVQFCTRQQVCHAPLWTMYKQIKAYNASYQLEHSGVWSGRCSGMWPGPCCLLENLTSWPYGAQEHIPHHVWKIVDTSNSAAMQDDGGDEVEVCALCFQSTPPHFAVRGECLPRQKPLK